jgi:hypothetical protein
MLAVLLSGLLAAACAPVPTQVNTLTGSGKTVTKSYDLRDFDRVEVNSRFDAAIEQGSGYAVSVTVDDNIVPYLDVVKDGRTLKIRLKPMASVTRGTLEAAVAMPALASLDLNGSARGEIGGFSSGARCTMTTNGGASLRGEITCGDAVVDANGGSSVALAGAAESLDLTVNGSASTNLSKFAAGDAKVDVNGGGKASVNVSGRLSGSVNGGGTVDYTGGPDAVNVRADGGGRVKGN